MSIYGEALGYDTSDGTGAFLSSVPLYIDKLKSSGDGFWTKATAKSDADGRFKSVFKSSSGTFRLRLRNSKTHALVDSSYAMVPDGQGGVMKLAFDYKARTPAFDLQNGDFVFVRAKLAKDASFNVTVSVWNDANTNGVRDKGEQPIEGALASLSYRRPSDGKYISVGKGETDTKGVFLLQNMRYRIGRSHTLRVRVDDSYAFTRRLETSYKTLDNDNDLDFDGRLRNFYIEAGQSVNIGGGVALKSELAHITGSAWEDVNGDGERISSEGTLRASVDLNRYSGYPNSTVRTSSNGGYSFDVVPVPGEVLYVHVEKHKYKTTKKLNDHFHDSPTDNDLDSNGNSIGVHLESAGDIARIDAGLQLESSPPPPPTTTTQPPTTRPPTTKPPTTRPPTTPPPTPPPMPCKFTLELINVYYGGDNINVGFIYNWRYEVRVNRGSPVEFPWHVIPYKGSDPDPQNTMGTSTVATELDATGDPKCGDDVELRIDALAHAYGNPPKRTIKTFSFTCDGTSGISESLTVIVDGLNSRKAKMEFTFLFTPECS